MSGKRKGECFDVGREIKEPTFSVFDARKQRWQQRKDAWIKAGIVSHLGRTTTEDQRNTNIDKWLRRKTGKGITQAGMVSVFDPVLAELIYRWYCPAEGVVLDPFAGGSVRGIVCSLLSRRYVGIELSKRQVRENLKQSKHVCGEPKPKWIVGDSAHLLRIVPAMDVDLIFSCPPYGNLERYSDDPRDLSNMSWIEFLHTYREICRQAVTLLKPDRFACFVVGDLRDSKGCYMNLPAQTISAFQDAGAKLYSEAVLLTCVGSAAVRARRPFTSSRKLAKVHQNVLIFVKGDPKRAALAIEESERGERAN